jgi:hypothetical protein
VVVVALLQPEKPELQVAKLLFVRFLVGYFEGKIDVGKPRRSLHRAEHFSARLSSG